MLRGIGSEFGLTARGGYPINYHKPYKPEWLRNASLVSNGRAALGLAGRYIISQTKASSPEILLPSYLCSSMIQPFEELGFRLAFYPVDFDLSFNLEALENSISENTVAIFLMYYFGLSQPTNLVSALREQYPHLTLLEDRTHMLLGDLLNASQVNENTLAIYSPRKWGPFPDLGLVKWAKTSKKEREIDPGIDTQFAVWRLYGLLLRTLFFTFPSETLRKSSLDTLKRGDEILDERIQIRHASFISRWLWHWWDWKRAAQIRQQNYRYLLENWPGRDIKPIFESLNDTSYPLNFPIRSKERDSLRKKLIHAGIFTPIHWQLPRQVDADKFPVAARLASEELSIIIDQRYSFKEMDYILETLCQI